jgi:hypothetical protein
MGKLMFHPTLAQPLGIGHSSLAAQGRVWVYGLQPQSGWICLVGPYLLYSGFCPRRRELFSQISFYQP